MTSVASLPWYDLPELRAHTDHLWRRVARALRDRGVKHVPVALDRETPLEAQWASPRFLFGQCCGYDVVLTHRERLRAVARPVYDGARAGPGRYRSLVLVSRTCDARSIEDLRGLRCVVNGCSSHSGMSVLRGLVSPLHVGGRFFSSVEVSGAHERSLDALAEGRADVAAIDSVVYALLARYRPAALAGLRVLVETPSAAAPPFVTSVHTPRAEVRTIRAALEEAFQDPDLVETRAALLLRGVLEVGTETYRSIRTCAERARARGYEMAETAPALA